MELDFVCYTKALAKYPGKYYVSLKTKTCFETGLPGKNFFFPAVSAEYIAKLRQLMLRIPHSYEKYRGSECVEFWRYWWAK